jgi:fibronectin type 3 domain-containing protein
MKKVLLVVLALLVVSAVAIVARQLKSGGRHSVTLNWQAATAAKGSAPLRYNIYRSDDAGRSYTQITRGVVETKYVDGSVQSGKSYRYVVTSIDGTGHESIRSEAIDVRVP